MCWDWVCRHCEGWGVTEISMETDSGVDQSKGVRAVTVHFSPGCYISTEFCQADSDSHTVDDDL